MDEKSVRALEASIAAMRDQAGRLMGDVDSAIIAIRGLERRILAVITDQEGDRRLWNPEAPAGGDVEYMQEALRRLHAVAKGEDTTWLDRTQASRLKATGWRLTRCPRCEAVAATSVTPSGIEIIACDRCGRDGALFMTQKLR